MTTTRTEQQGYDIWCQPLEHVAELPFNNADGQPLAGVALRQAQFGFVQRELRHKEPEYRAHIAAIESLDDIPQTDAVGEALAHAISLWQSMIGDLKREAGLAAARLREAEETDGS